MKLLSTKLLSKAVKMKLVSSSSRLSRLRSI